MVLRTATVFWWTAGFDMAAAPTTELVESMSIAAEASKHLQAGCRWKCVALARRSPGVAEKSGIVFAAQVEKSATRPVLLLYGFSPTKFRTWFTCHEHRGLSNTVWFDDPPTEYAACTARIHACTCVPEPALVTRAMRPAEQADRLCTAAAAAFRQEALNLRAAGCALLGYLVPGPPP